MNNVCVSYKDIIQSFRSFKKVDSKGFNRFDSPANLYFKIVFYFNEDQGLLGLDNMKFDDTSSEFEKKIAALTSAFNGKGDKMKDEPATSVKTLQNVTLKNTAYHYLLLNDELERARMLKKFVLLLSNINSTSPWYFSEITGLDGALERKMFDQEFKIEERKTISIKCLPDAYDNRIGTLLDLYRAICYSYQMKKEILPANLRKFNMGILLFNAPIRGLGGKSGDSDAKIMIPEGPNDFYISSCKLIELRNCEIDQNSSKSAYGTLKTEEPLAPEYTINIAFDDCYESRYNEVMQYVITDFLNVDIQPRETEQYVDAYGKSYEGTRQLRLTNSGEDFKNYWTDTDYSGGEAETKIYDNPINHESTDLAKRDANDIGGKSPLTSQVTNTMEKAKNAVKIPGFSTKENIHDNGTVNQFGTYEYLNRISGSDSAIGKLASTGAQQALKGVKSKVAGLFLGNIYGNSVSDYLMYARQAASADIPGLVANVKNKKESEQEQLKDKKLPQYSKQKTEQTGNANQLKSIYNNL